MAEDDDRADDEMTIDELARESGMTARNIRAHQSRGLLPAPVGPGPDRLLRPRASRPDPADPGHAGAGLQPEVDRAPARHGRSQRQPRGARVPARAAGAVRQRGAGGRSTPTGVASIFGDPPDRKLIAKAEKIGLLDADRRGDLGGPLADAAARRARPDRARHPARARDRGRRVDQQAHDRDREGVRPPVRQGRPASRSARTAAPRGSRRRRRGGRAAAPARLAGGDGELRRGDDAGRRAPAPEGASLGGRRRPSGSSPGSSVGELG